MISVIIPTRNRRPLLARVLASLKRQSLPHDQFEIFVVDDGSSDDTAAWLSAEGVSFVSIANQGPAGARNAGVQHTTGEVLAFIDDDAIAHHDWLKTIRSAFEDRRHIAAAEGDIISTGPRKPMTHSVHHKGPGARLTCNFAVTRACFKEAGGFNPHFRYTNEDLEFCLRLLRGKRAITYLRNMTVFHPVQDIRFTGALAGAFKFAAQTAYSEFLLEASAPGEYRTVKFAVSAAGTLRRMAARYTLSQARTNAGFLLPHPIRFCQWMLVCVLRQMFLMLMCIPAFRKITLSRLNPGINGCRRETSDLQSVPDPLRPRMLLIWTGGVMPGYRGLFEELARYFELRVLSPRRWKHGSRTQEMSAGASSYTIIPSAFIPPNSSRYLVPRLPAELIGFRPRYIYIMDEPDRMNTFLHLLMCLLCSPFSRRVTYSLQNLPSPSYYGSRHRMALKLNFLLLSGAAAATEEARQVLAGHGFRGSSSIIRLGVCPRTFYPGDRTALRERLTIDERQTVLIYAGSLSPEKGVLQLAQAVIKFPRLLLLIAGTGPLEKELASLEAGNVRLFGAVEQDKLRELFQASEYVILPSRTSPGWKEQVGRSLLEGILCGCTALGSSSGSIPEIAATPDAIFDEKDENSLHSLLGRLPLAKEAAIRESQRKAVGAAYTWERVAEQVYHFMAGDLE